MIQPKKSLGGKKLPASDVHQSAPPLQFNCAEPNHKSTAFEVILISICLTDLYITFRGGKITVLDTCLNYRDCSSKSEEMLTQKNILHFDLGFSISPCDIVSGSCRCVCLSSC